MPTSTESEPRSAAGVTKAETFVPAVPALVVALAVPFGVAVAPDVPPPAAVALTVGRGAWTVTGLAPSASVITVPSGKRLSKDDEACSMRQFPLTRSDPACTGVREMTEPRPPATFPLSRTRELTALRASTAFEESTGTRCEAQVS